MEMHKWPLPEKAKLLAAKADSTKSNLGFDGIKTMHLESLSVTYESSAATVDKLETIFKLQNDLQTKFQVDIHGKDFKKTMLLAMMVELGEAAQEMQDVFKYWKTTSTTNRENLKLELVDTLHFFVNLCLSVDITAEELFEAFLKKNKMNHERQDAKY
jgi:dimeric dUTPase (all-alpha-NTP-PPase superfamily)